MTTASQSADLSLLPSVNDVIELFEGQAPFAHGLVVMKARDVLSSLRERIHCGEPLPASSKSDLVSWVADEVRLSLRPGLRRVINATGVVLHTGLGRAPLSDEAVDALKWAARYCNVQADLEEGKRSRRETHVESLLRHITGCEAALVVNNNAAATLLTLTAIAKGKEVIVSRGELVEIGGSFRIPEVMAQSGAILVEVGCTNQTHLSDYVNAIGENTGVLLKVHTSNYKIQGFTGSVSLSRLSELAKANDLILVHDMGSGSLIDLEAYGLGDEPPARRSLEDGADLVTFSGDKLVGGPQAGVIIGKQSLVDGIRTHPLARAVRVDKLVLATMEATLRSFTDPRSAVERIPGLAMITMGREKIRKRASRFVRRLRRRAPHIQIRLIDGISKVGSGAFPVQELPTVLVEVSPPQGSAGDLARRLRKGEPSVFARVAQDKVLLDLRTVFPEEEKELVASVAEVLEC